MALSWGRWTDAREEMFDNRTQRTTRSNRHAEHRRQTDHPPAADADTRRRCPSPMPIPAAASRTPSPRAAHFGILRHGPSGALQVGQGNRREPGGRRRGGAFCKLRTGRMSPNRRFDHRRVSPHISPSRLSSNSMSFTFDGLPTILRRHAGHRLRWAPPSLVFCPSARACSLNHGYGYAFGRPRAQTGKILRDHRGPW